jgi:DNA invertase Pin-like site-specific DNA recombinase
VILTSIGADERLTASHRARLAYVYVRQSTPNQVRHHQESTELQYRLIERAVTLGWPRERVTVIDEDLGKSGAPFSERDGFNKLIAEVGLGHAGLVISLDASRLARNNRDWHQLLELCSLFGVLIADGERIYDPGAYHDRLLLGLSGIMSEAELHQIRVRLHQGVRQKAARGELHLPMPAGLSYDRAGAIVLNPDEEVQARLHLVFAKFRELQNARAVMRYLRTNQLLLPVRPSVGPAPHEVIWRDANSARVRTILQNPAYAGAYVFGRRRREPTRRRPGSMRVATTKVAIGEWEVCLRAAHPGYIGWEQFMANQRILKNNAARYSAKRTGAAREGSALLQGIAVCGCCGQHMHLEYSGRQGQYPVYSCRADHDLDGVPKCQSVRALPVDALIETLLLDALTPDRIAIAVCALGELKSETTQLEKQWALRRERARYDAERARRQYDAVEPENRLVARSLERIWEDKLRAVEVIEQEYEQWRCCAPEALSDADHAALLNLGVDLPRIWQAETTAAGDRKQILRFIMREVLLDQKREPGNVLIKIIWQTGVSTEHRLQRRAFSYRQHADLTRLQQRVEELNAAHKMDHEIAEELNREGFTSARGGRFTRMNVSRLRKLSALPAARLNAGGENQARWPDGSYSVQGAAQALGVTPQTVFNYLWQGRLQGHQIAKGLPWRIDLSHEQITEVRARLRSTTRAKKEAS